ncbi:hypothetical protein ES708_33459 [subsurface metagenome]
MLLVMPMAMVIRGSEIYVRKANERSVTKMNRELDLEVKRMIEEFCGEDNRIIEKKISEEGLNAIKEAIGSLNKYKEDFPGPS